MWRHVLKLVVALTVVVASCGDPYQYPQPDWAGQGDRNHAPILAPVGTVTAEEGDRVRIVLSAQDPDLDAVTFIAEPIPSGAVFDTQYGVFEWIAPVGSAATSPYRLTFGATDGDLMTTTPAVIVIEPATFAIARVNPDRVPATGGTRVTVEGVGFSSPAIVRVGSVEGLDVEVHADRRLQFTTPPLHDYFGPQQLSITLPDGRSAFASNAIFVYREAAEIFASAKHYPLGLSAVSWDSVDVDGDGTDEVFAVGDEGCILMNPGHDGLNAVNTDICDAPAVQVVAAGFDGNDLGDAAILTASGEVFVALDGRPVGDEPLHHEDAPVRIIAAFDLEPDGDAEILAIDQQGVGWVYMAVGGGRFARPVTSSQLGVPTRVSIVDLDGDRVGDALLEYLGGFGVAIGVETGAFLPFELQEDGTGYFAPALEIGNETPTIAAVGSDHVGYFEAIDRRWRQVHARPFDDLLGQDADLLDLDGDGVSEVVSTGAGFPGARVDRERYERFQQDGWWMTGPVQGPPGLADLDGNSLTELAFLSDTGEAIVTLPIDQYFDLQGPTGFFTDGGESLTTHDFNYDGYDDLVVLGAQLDGVPAHLLFRGGFTMQSEPALYPARWSWSTYAVGDFTGDGWADTVGGGEDESLDCFPSRGGGVFETPVTIELEGVPVNLVALHREYAAAQLVIHFEDTSVRLYDLGQRCEIFSQDTISMGADAIFAVDVDLDRWLELIVREGERVVLFAYQFGRFNREVEVEIGPREYSGIAAGDVDGDGFLDLLLAGEDGLHLLNRISDARTTLEPPLEIDRSPASDVAVGDLNGDGGIEIVVTGGGTPPRFFRRVEDGYVSERGPAWHAAAESPVFADLDGDVDTELVTLEPGFGPVIWWNEPPPVLTVPAVEANFDTE